MALHCSGKMLRYRFNLLTSFIQAGNFQGCFFTKWPTVKLSTDQELYGISKLSAVNPKVESTYNKYGASKSSSFGYICESIKNSSDDIGCSSVTKSLKTNSEQALSNSKYQTSIKNDEECFDEKKLNSHEAKGNIHYQVKTSSLPNSTMVFLLERSFFDIRSQNLTHVTATSRTKIRSVFKNTGLRTQQSFLNPRSHARNREAFQRDFFSTSSRLLSGATIETAESDKKRLMAEISQEVGSPDWVQLLRDFTLVPFGEDMEDFVDLVGIPYMERYTSDEKWVMESLMVLLISMEVNRIKDPRGAFTPTSRQNTISSILMMIRLMCRIHQEMNDTTFPEQGDVGSALLQTVLIGDMVAGTYLRAAANINAPKVTEVLMSAASDLQSYFVPKLHPSSIEGNVEEQNKPCSRDSQSTSQAAAQYDHVRDDMPAPLMAACEAIVIDSGLDQRLQERVRKFAYHISLARSLNKGLDVNPNGQPTSADLTAPENAKFHSDTALNCLMALSYPESRSLSMLKRLARVYAAV